MKTLDDLRRALDEYCSRYNLPFNLGDQISIRENWVDRKGLRCGDGTGCYFFWNIGLLLLYVGKSVNINGRGYGHHQFNVDRTDVVCRRSDWLADPSAAFVSYVRSQRPALRVVGNDDIGLDLVERQVEVRTSLAGKLPHRQVAWRDDHAEDRSIRLNGPLRGYLQQGVADAAPAPILRDDECCLANSVTWLIINLDRAAKPPRQWSGQPSVR